MRWFVKNITSLLLAFLLAIIVWVSATTASDPNQEEVFVIPLEVLGQGEDIVVLGNLPSTVSVKIYAPRSRIEKLKEEKAIKAWISLADLGAGVYEVPIKIDIPDRVSPIQHLSTVPAKVDLTLDKLVTKEFPVERKVEGEPAIGYQAGEIIWETEIVTVSGRVSQVEKIEKIGVVLDIAGANETIKRVLTLQPVDSMGEKVVDVTLNPPRIQVTQEVELLGGYRNVAVKIVTTGQVAPGYRVMSITPAPATVMVFSENPALVNQIPGYVETEPLDITDADDYMETILELNLPETITVVGDPTVLAQVSITAFNDSLKLSREVEVIGLRPGLQAVVAPQQIEVIVYGPVPILDNLTLRDVRVIVDLTNLDVGVYTITPIVDILSEDLQEEATLPNKIEVTITEAATSTTTPTVAP